MNRPAPVPPLGFSAAITGHRPERLTDPEAVKRRVAEVLRGIRRSAGQEARLRLVSALAEGADRLGAQAALDEGVALDAVLPFPADEYLGDFDSQASREEFLALLRKADGTLILDGAPEPRAKAYEAAGKALLDNCDILIAVWDGEAGRGRGGTREVIEEAVRRGIPVVAMDAGGGSLALRLSPASTSGTARLEDVPDTPIEKLDTVVAGILGSAAAGRAQAEWLNKSALPRPTWVQGTYPMLLRLVGLGPKRRKGQAHAAEDPAPPLESAFLWWDATAIQAAQAFRSAVIVNFALAALAVALAACSLLTSHGKWLFVLAEVITILLLLANNWRAKRWRWHERWLEAREVAEMLRVSLMLRKVGIGRGLGRSGSASSSETYAVAMARSLPLQTVDLSDVSPASKALVEEIAGQADWNERNAVRMRKAGHRIGRIGEVLFTAVLVAAIAWLILAAVDPALAERMKYLLTVVTAGFPAIASASYGIRVILDFEGVAERSRRLAADLRGLLGAWEASPATAASLQAFAQSAADIMLGDVAAWRMLAEGRRLAIPG